MRRITWAALAALLFCGGVAAQGAKYTDSVLRPPAVIAGASIRVCTDAATGTPCTPLASIYSDKALTSLDADSVVAADSRGLFDFYALPACYKLQISASGFSTNTITVCLPFTPDADGDLVFDNASTRGIEFRAGATGGTKHLRIVTGNSATGAGPDIQMSTGSGGSGATAGKFLFSGGNAGSGTGGGSFDVDAGPGSSTGSGGIITLDGGGVAGGAQAAGGVFIAGGNVSSAGTGAGGSVTLTPGTSSAGSYGSVVLGRSKLVEITYTPADTTPTVRAGNYMVVANGGAVSITAFDDGVDGQLLILKFSDNNTTLVDAAGLQLAGGSNFNPTADDIVVLIRISSVWYELSRSEN